MNKINGIKFVIKGKMASFRRPETNKEIFMTFPHIHKISLYGIFGAITGKKGYNNTKKSRMPEFYETYKNIKVSIVPKKPKFKIKNIKYTDTTGSSSYEKGGTFIVNEQTIIEPEYDIYVASDDSYEFGELKDFLLNNKTIYEPYLGKNEHSASIIEISEFEGYINDKQGIISSITKAEIQDRFLKYERNIRRYKYIFTLPIALDNKYGNFQYIYNDFMISSGVYNLHNLNVYNVENKNLFFI